MTAENLDPTLLGQKQNLYDQDFISPAIEALAQNPAHSMPIEGVRRLISIVACRAPLRYRPDGPVIGLEERYRSTAEVLTSVSAPGNEYPILIGGEDYFRKEKIERSVIRACLGDFPKVFENILGWAEYIQPYAPGSKYNGLVYYVNGDPNPRQKGSVATRYEFWLPTYIESLERDKRLVYLGLEEVVPEGYRHASLIPDDGRKPANRVFPQSRSAEVDSRSIFIPKPPKEE